jgi:hypothetical protein
MKKYKKICEAILILAKEDNIDFRIIMKKWITLFEESRVVGWNREEFMDCMVECKKEMEKNENSN